MSVYAIAVGLVVDPVPLVYISVSMDETALPISFVISPPSFVDRSVRPYLLALAVFLIRVWVPVLREGLHFSEIFSSVLDIKGADVTATSITDLIALEHKWALTLFDFLLG